MQQAFNALQWLISEYRRVALSVLLIAFAFPFITTAILYGERVGYFPNVHQIEHQQLQEITRGITANVDRNNRQLRVNHDLIASGVYYQQRTCVNTANTKEEKEACVKKFVGVLPWRD